jgi:hypothetical protein
MACSGQCALHAAAQNGDIVAVEALVKAGANVNQLVKYVD